MFRKIAYIITLIFFLSNFINAQSELRFEFDYARFNYDSQSVFMEFYYELNPAGMSVIETSEGLLTEAVVRIQMKDIQADTFYINRDWIIQNYVEEIDGEQRVNISSGVLGFPVPEGKYSLIIKAYDSKNQQLAKTISETIDVVPFKNNHFSISDIELAANIKKEGADPSSLFYKNTLEIIPNPSMVYSVNMPVLFYYAELYNLVLKNPGSDFTFKRQLYNSMGSQVNIQEKNIKQRESALVEYGLINLSKYPTDT